GHVALFDLVVDARERQRELVVREADVRKVRVDPAEVLGVEVDVELALLGVVVHGLTILVAWTGSAHAGSPSRLARSARCSRSGRSASAGPRTRAGCSPSTARSSRAPCSAWTRFRRTTRRESSRSSWCSQG